MKPRQKRLAMIAGGLVALGVTAAFVLAAFQENLVFFFTPSQVAAKEVPQGRSFRVGGMVTPGSVKRQPDGVTVQFVVTDTAKSIPVVYRRSEEHTSELQSLTNLVCRLLLEKKNRRDQLEQVANTNPHTSLR